MVKFYKNSFSYEYSFPAVSLAYFLRYPNPYATHVLSTDVIDQHFDPISQRLSTTRLHLKRSKIPPAVLKILPKGILGGSSDAGQSYVLEKSVVDAKEGWMETETRNLEWTGILSVVEKQIYRRSPISDLDKRPSLKELVDFPRNEGTDVATTTTLLSRYGQAKYFRRRGDAAGQGSDSSDDEAPTRKGFFSTWSTTSLQRSIEGVGLRRTRAALAKSKDGMNVVLDRLRQGGLGGVLDGMRRDLEIASSQEKQKQ
ncbi:MAG: hypothetical protein Q9191_003670 [Dirinaria sp. TL-2023a]